MLFYTHNNILYVFIFNKHLNSLETQKIQEYTKQNTFLGDSFLLTDAQYEVYEQKVREILKYNLATTKNLRANLRRIMDTARDRQHFLIKVNKSLDNIDQIINIIKLCVGISACFHIISTVYFIDDE